jgi:hypothetical protein
MKYFLFIFVVVGVVVAIVFTIALVAAGSKAEAQKREKTQQLPTAIARLAPTPAKLKPIASRPVEVAPSHAERPNDADGEPSMLRGPAR